MIKKFEIDGLDAMQNFAESIAAQVFPQFVIGLVGDLGAGKTTFTQFFGAALGVKDSITSPTFTIMKHYQGDVFLTHIDAYRLEGIGEDPLLEEYLDGDGVSVVEWYPYLTRSMPETFLKIHIDYIDETKRQVMIEGEGRYETIVSNLMY